MKKLSITLLTAFLLFFCASTVLAQSQKGTDNKTAKFEFVWTDPGLPIYCDGNVVDILAGSYNVQWIVIRKDGNPVKTHSILSGEATSIVTGEVFKAHEKDLAVPDFDGIVYAHYNFKGNQGSHYIGRIIVDFVTGAFTIEKTICPGN